MTREEAIKILSPDTTAAALAEVEYYNGFSGHTAKVQAVSEACDLAVEALKRLSLDVVEVIRCADCKYSFVVTHLDGKRQLSCTEIGKRNLKDNDFCSYGKLRK